MIPARLSNGQSILVSFLIASILYQFSDNIFCNFIVEFSGLFTDPAKSSDIANSVDDTEEVYFIPAFSGLGVR